MVDFASNVGAQGEIGNVEIVIENEIPKALQDKLKKMGIAGKVKLDTKGQNNP